MLDYDFIFEKGILFIKIKGDINKKTSSLFENEINPLVLDNGIKKVVLNLSNLENIDKYGINVLRDSYMTLRKESEVFISDIPYYLQGKLKKEKMNIHY